MELRREDFGDGFHWGVSAAAYQTEGAWAEDGKGHSIWDVFSKQRKKIFAGHNGDHACEFYHRYTQDIALMHSMHIPNFRFSLAWSRIFPNGSGAVNQAGVDFYHRLIDLCLEMNIEPWITLYHWDLPQALEERGGWTNRDIVGHLEDYTAFCIDTFGDKVKHWMILNEPMVFTGAGYFLGVHAPGKRGLTNFLSAVHHAVLAQAGGIRTAKSLRSDISVGTTFSCSSVHASSFHVKDMEAAVRADALINRMFVEPLTGLGYPVSRLPFLRRMEKYMQQHDETKMQAEPDFIGIQNYTREVVKHSPFIPYIHLNVVKASKRTKQITEMNWEIYPSAMGEMLRQFSKYKKPLIVTENGAAFKDEPAEGEIHDVQRSEFIQQNIQEVYNAKKNGTDVRGYFVWSFTDNFEWAEGYRPRFGLVYVDYATQKRYIKASGHWYSRWLRRTDPVQRIAFMQDATARLTTSDNSGV